MRRLLCTLQMGLVLLVGCGQGTYDERLEKRISELKSAPPAAAENDGQEGGEEGGEEEATEEDQAAAAEEDAAAEK